LRVEKAPLQAFSHDSLCLIIRIVQRSGCCVKNRNDRGRSNGPNSSIFAWDDGGVDTIVDILSIRLVARSSDRGISFGGLGRGTGFAMTRIVRALALTLVAQFGDHRIIRLIRKSLTAGVQEEDI
jgi:hypothetical protein